MRNDDNKQTRGCALYVVKCGVWRRSSESVPRNGSYLLDKNGSMALMEILMAYEKMVRAVLSNCNFVSCRREILRGCSPAHKITGNFLLGVLF